ncbi:MAG: NAD kinase [Bacteroidales bacterium]|nr:NAD kinase [Bacteroidales bacterium]
MKIPSDYRTIYLFGRSFDAKFLPSFKLVLQKLAEYEAEILVFQPFREFLNGSLSEDLSGYPLFRSYEDLKGRPGLMLSIGGDGTFLEASTLVRDLPVPIAGINSGRLGFLADIAQEEISRAVDSILTGDWDIQERTLIQVDCDQPLFGDFNFALNEITVHKRDDSSMIRINASLDGLYLNTYWADGLIVATPTGSTAYSLSVGGPLVLPGTGTFVLSPIAPHHLTVRPLIYRDNLRLTLQTRSRSGNLLVSADSRSVIIEDRLELRISKAPFALQTIRLRDHNIYQTLRSKLMWGADPRNFDNP